MNAANFCYCENYDIIFFLIPFFTVILKIANLIGAKLFLVQLTFSSLFYNSFTNGALAIDTGEPWHERVCLVCVCVCVIGNVVWSVL